MDSGGLSTMEAHCREAPQRPVHHLSHSENTMEHAAICFTPAVPLQAKRLREITVSQRNSHILTCSLRKNVPKSCASLRKAATSPFFEALPDELPPGSPLTPPPEHRRIPIIGFLVDHYTGKSRTALSRKYGSIYKSTFVSGPLIYITDMSTIKDVLKNPQLFTTKGASKIVAKIFGEETMLLLDGPEHAALRHKVAPGFTSAVFPFLFDKIGTRALKTWASLQKAVIEKGKQKVDPAMRRNYLSLLVEITTGIDMDSEMATYLQDRFFMLNKLFFSPPFGPFWEQGAVARSEIMTVIEERINMYLSEEKETIHRLREYADKLSYKSVKDIKKGDVNVLLVAIASSNLKAGPGEENDPKEITSLADLILLLWFAGFATSAATTSCGVFEMGMDKAIWDELYAEQDTLIREAGDTDVTYEQVVSKMPLLDSFITEMLRMHPAVQGGVRMLTQDAKVLGKYLKRGDRVFIDYSSAMRDPRMYPDPDVLKIDRFVRKEGEVPPPNVISFGTPGSAHFCLGAALAKIMIRTTLAVLLREYSIVLDPKQSREYAIIPDLTPRSKVLVQSMSKRN